MDIGKSDSDEQWYWSKKGSGERCGPVSREGLKELAEEGDLESEDLVWRKGLDDWREADSVKVVAKLFTSPPPLPENPSGRNPEQPLNSSQVGSDHENEDDGSEKETSVRLPEEFRVKWEGSLWNSSCTIKLTDKEFKLTTKSGDKYSLGYRNVNLKRTRGEKMTVETPLALNENFDSTQKCQFSFTSKERARCAENIIVESKKQCGGPTSYLPDKSDIKEYDVSWGFYAPVDSKIYIGDNVIVLESDEGINEQIPFDAVEGLKKQFDKSMTITVSNSIIIDSSNNSIYLKFSSSVKRDEANSKIISNMS